MSYLLNFSLGASRCSDACDFDITNHLLFAVLFTRLQCALFLIILNHLNSNLLSHFKSQLNN